MDGIKDYLITVISAVILGTLSETIVSSMKTEHPGIEKTVRLGLSLCIMAVMIIPITGLVSNSESLNVEYFKTEDYTVDDSFYIIEKEAEGEASDYIFQKTGIKPTYVRIDIVMKDNENAEITKAVIGIENKYREKDQEIKQAGLECIGREVSIKYAD